MVPRRPMKHFRLKTRKSPGACAWVGALWVVLIATYASAHSTFYWSGFRQILDAVPLDLRQWQLLHFVVWTAVVPGWSVLILVLLIRRTPIPGWRVQELLCGIMILVTIAVSLFLIVVFQPESELRGSKAWISTSVEIFVVLVVPSGVMILLAAFWVGRRRSRAHAK